MLITGHYEFEILLKYSSSSDNILEDILIYRRYSDLEWLHNELLQNNPGCKIIDIPEKSFWTNIKANNNDLLENRKKLIDQYLNYINKHLYLCKNKSFREFLSNNFNAENFSRKRSLYDNIMLLTNQIPIMFQAKKTIGVNIIEDDQMLDRERENLVRLLNSTEKISNTMVKIQLTIDDKKLI